MPSTAPTTQTRSLLPAANPWCGYTTSFQYFCITTKSIQLTKTVSGDFKRKQLLLLTLSSSDKSSYQPGPRDGKPRHSVFTMHLFLQNSFLYKKDGVGFGPRTPAPGPITFRLLLEGIYPVLADSDGVGFETIRYYLIINTIKDLYCAVLRKIATTCDYAVTDCHEIHLPHFQAEILSKMPSPFETKLISIRPQ